MPSIVPRAARQVAFRFLVAGTAAAVTATALVTSSGFAAPNGIVALPPRAAVTDLRALDDGTVGISTGAQDARFWKTSSLRIGERGRVGQPLTVDRRSTYAAAAFSPNGELVLMRHPRWTAGRNASVDLRVLSASGQSIGRPTTFRAEKKQQILGETPSVGPTGAAIVQMTESTATGYRRIFSFRPAGVTRFSSPVLLRSTTRAEAKQSDTSADGIDTTFKIALSRDGGGALLALPESKTAGTPYLRRISSTGQLGPVIGLQLAAGSATAGELMFDEEGRLDVAVASWKTGSTTWATNGHVYAVSLAAGANAASPLQDLGEVTDGAYNLVLQLAAMEGGHSAVLVGAAFQKDLRLFEGTATLSEVSSAGIGWRQIAMHALPGGRLFFSWEDVGDRSGVYSSVRTPEGTITELKRLTPKLAGGTNVAVKNIAVLSDGRVGLAWTELTSSARPDRTYARIVVP